MIDAGWCRPYVNKQLNRIRHLFKWAVAEELVPASVLHSLQAVAGLKRGRSDAPDPEPVKPVPMDRVDAIQPFVAKQVWAMIQLQLYTAARAGEICQMRPCDIDRSGKIWVFKMQQHKTAHHGFERKIFIGPRGQAVLAPFLLRDPQAGRFAGITDWAGKLPGAVARLAALMHCAKYALEPAGPADRRIDCETVQCSVRLGDLLAEHTLIVFGMMADNSALEAARKVWHHIQSTQTTAFTFSNIWHPLRGTFKTSEDIEPAVEMLLDHYLILQVEDKPLNHSGRRGRRFIVNPKAMEV